MALEADAEPLRGVKRQGDVDETRCRLRARQTVMYYLLRLARAGGDVEGATLQFAAEAQKRAKTVEELLAS